MNRLIRPLIGALLTGVLLAPVVTSFPVSAASSAQTRYAAVKGKGDACTKASPCSLSDATSGSTSDDVVVVTPGTYGSAKNAITVEVPQGVTVHAQSGKAEPLIYTTGQFGMDVQNNSVISELHLTYVGPTYGLVLANDAIADRVSIVATKANASACYASGTLTNSVCRSTGTSGNGLALEASGLNAFGRVVGVDALATGSSGVGIYVYADDGGSANLTAVNTIAYGKGSSTHVATDTSGSGSPFLSLAYDSATSNVTTGPGASLTSSHDVGAAAFVSLSKSNFRERASSPTVNAGETSNAQGTLDLAGDPRVLGKSVDIGADEFVTKPSLGHFSVSHRGQHALTVAIAVTAHGAPTTAQLLVSGPGKNPKTSAHSAGSRTHSHLLHLSVKHLHRHTTYTLRVRATNAGGSVTTTHKKATTT